MRVACPRRGVVDVMECSGCPDCIGVSINPDGSFLYCTLGPDRKKTVVAKNPPAIRSRAGEIRVAEIMSSPVRTVRDDLGVEELVGFFLKHNISGAPVVDAEGCPVGVVSKTDLLRLAGFASASSAEGRAARAASYDLDLNGLSMASWGGVTARDVMAPILFHLPEDATVAQAAALMAFEGIHRVPIVRERQIVGMVSSLDVLRWLAQEDGFVVPRSTSAKLPPPDADSF